MRKRNLFYKLVGSSLVAAFILAACNGAATMVAPASATATWTPIAPSATFTAIPSETETASPIPSATSSPTATEPATPTEEMTPQVNPGMNANCRKGPGMNYFAITFLTAGTPYIVIGQNGLNTWWLVEAPGKLTCWIGDPTSVLLGPVWQVSIITAPPLPLRPSPFVATRTCDAKGHVLSIAFTWATQDYLVGYHLYRNGDLLKDFGPQASDYQDNSAPFGVELVYKLEAFNEYGVAYPATASLPPCG